MALRAAACATLALAALLPLCCWSLSVQTAEAELGHGHGRSHKHGFAPTEAATLHGQEGAWSPLTEEQRNASLKVWLEDYNQSSEWVDKLKVHPAKETDRVAVTILQPATPEKVKLMAHIIRINMHRLGPKWGLAVYYAQESEKEALSNALGNPQNIVWAPIYLRGERVSELGRVQFSYYLLSMDFWKEIPKAMEHVLIFGDDSIVLRGDGCIDQFTSYDYVGAPWHWALKNMPRFGGNGGFRLVRRSSSTACLDNMAFRVASRASASTYARNGSLGNTAAIWKVYAR